MNANVRCTVEQRIQNFNETYISYRLGTDSIYLRFKPTIWALHYPCIANTPSALPRLKNVIFSYHNVIQECIHSTESEQRLQSSLLYPQERYADNPTQYNDQVVPCGTFSLNSNRGRAKECSSQSPMPIYVRWCAIGALLRIEW